VVGRRIGGTPIAGRPGGGEGTVASDSWATNVRTPGGRLLGGRDDVPSVTILHVSDTQFGEYHRFGEGIDSLASNLIVDLRRLGDEGIPQIDLIVFSGDVAEKGLRSEYVPARGFVGALCTHAGLEYERVVVVPGNHDVNWGGRGLFCPVSRQRGVSSPALQSKMAALPGVCYGPAWPGCVYRGSAVSATSVR
jgi:hypothetical protein